MGFRSTFTTFESSIKWPEWFIDKYKDTVAFSKFGTGLISSLTECKTYGAWENLHNDIQRAIDWDDHGGSFVLVYLHECGGITLCMIARDGVRWAEPTEWERVNYPSHGYHCGSCAARAIDQ